MLTTVLDGTDFAATPPLAPTRIAEFTYSTFDGWHPHMTAAASCTDRFNGSTDNSAASCINVGADSFKTYRYEYSALAPEIGQLLSRVERPIVSPSGAVAFATDESFVWTGDAAGPLVSVHRSQGVELSAPSGPRHPSGTHTWVRNGVPMPVTFERNRVVKTERCPNGSCDVRQSRTIQTAASDVRAPVGYSSSVAGDKVTTLRFVRDDGLTELEAEVVPASATAAPSMQPSISGGARVVTFAGITAWRRVTPAYSP